MRKHFYLLSLLIFPCSFLLAEENSSTASDGVNLQDIKESSVKTPPSALSSTEGQNIETSPVIEIKKAYYEEESYLKNFAANSLLEGPGALTHLTPTIYSLKPAPFKVRDPFRSNYLFAQSFVVTTKKEIFQGDGPFSQPNFLSLFLTNTPYSYPTSNCELFLKEKWYFIKKIIFAYQSQHKKQIPAQELASLKIPLHQTKQGYHAPQKEDNVLFSPGDIKAPTSLSQSAIKEIASTVVQEYNKKGIYGIDVSLSEAAEDQLIFLIRTAKIAKVETKKKVGHKEPICNGPKDTFFAKNSPIKEGDLFNKDELDDYLFYLNRYPSRRVDVNLKPMIGDEVGLEFYIDEKKPWLVWANVANSGVKGTEKYIESFGYNQNHLFLHDDIFRLFYSTDAFQHVHSVYTNYQAPLFLLKKTRWEVDAGYNRFISTELGTQVRLYTGEQIPASGKLIFTAFQSKNLFVDIIPSIEYRHVKVNNPSWAVTHTLQSHVGKQNFLMPGLEIDLEKREREYHVLLSIGGQACPTFGFSRKQIDLLGREDTSHRWYTIDGDLFASFYIDPLLVHATPTTSLVNEVTLRLRGEYAFKYRLIPQERMVIGGMNTVRGYRESTSYGDNYYLSSIEYLCHLPRLLSPVPPKRKLFGKTFRVAPEYKGGPTDWDLILRAFFDVGRVTNNKKMVGEVNSTLMGTGLGLELVILDNLYIRGDWGFRLKSVQSPNIRDFYSKNKSRGYLSMTLVF